MKLQPKKMRVSGRKTGLMHVDRAISRQKRPFAA